MLSMLQDNSVTQSKTVSIALCTCNGGKYLEAQLASLVAQTVLPDEIVICDDASTDTTLRVIESFSNQCQLPVIFLQNRSRIGTIKNFEKAISTCSGDVIFLADQDDVWFNNKIETVLSAFDKHPLAGYVFSDSELVRDDLQPLSKRLWSSVGFTGSRYRRFAEGEQLPVMLKGGNFIYGNTMAFRKSYIRDILPIDSSSNYLTHDTWISLVLSASGRYGVPIDAPLIQYRQHSQQQAGAGKELLISEKAAQVLEDKRDYFREYADALCAVRERLTKIDQPSTRVNLRILTDCMRHFEARSLLYSVSKMNKILIILAEVLSGRYARFSSSWKSALKDFLTTQ